MLSCSEGQGCAIPADGEGASLLSLLGTASIYEQLACLAPIAWYERYERRERCEQYDGGMCLYCLQLLMKRFFGIFRVPPPEVAYAQPAVLLAPWYESLPFVCWLFYCFGDSCVELVVVIS